MKSIKLLALLVASLLVVIPIDAQTAPAKTAAAAAAAAAPPSSQPQQQPQRQRTISDISESEFDEFEMMASGTFAERKLVGKVVGVHDGDTATVLDADKTQYKFRFNGIDAPELKMDFGNKAKENLSSWIFGKEVTVIYGKIDKYGRFVGTIYVNGVDVNLEQIKSGLAWHYKKYAGEQTEKDRVSYAEAEIAAREAKKGLWVQPNRTAPWDYRANLKVRQATEKAGRKYLVGAKGGCYYINSAGNKTYVKDSFCENAAAAPPPAVADTNSPEPAASAAPPTKPATGKGSATGGRTYVRGSRGGCYYLNSAGKKVYVDDKSLCGN